MKAQFKKETKFLGELIYPVNEIAHIICGITDTKTLPRRYIKPFTQLGVEIEILGVETELFKGE